MVQIVGKDPGVVKRVTCRKCASILEYTEMEVTEEYIREYGGGGDTYRRIRCPCCNNKQDVK
jgi:RNase P subunit RPR2